jgi:chromodomain-helicase-DNA-binding protein 1
MMYGSTSPMDEPGLSMEFQDHASDSDLSEIREMPNHNAAPSPSTVPSQEEAEEDEEDEEDEETEEENEVVAEADHDQSVDESSEDDASDDQDFQDQDSAAAAEESEMEEHDSRSSSLYSRRTGKRKRAAAMEDEYMNANPELYGLRRSVCRFRLVASHGEKKSEQSHVD